MDEKTFFDYLDKKFDAVGNILDEHQILLNKILEYLEIKAVVQANLADFSDKPKAVSRYEKKMPEILGDYTISQKGCNRCGGKITWDNYSKETHPYPDHVDENGELLDNCPAYVPNKN